MMAKAASVLGGRQISAQATGVAWTGRGEVAFAALPVGTTLGWAEGALNGGTQVAQLSSAPAVQHACGWLQQPIAAAATATLALHSTAPSKHATKQRWSQRCGRVQPNMFVTVCMLAGESYSHK